MIAKRRPFRIVPGGVRRAGSATFCGGANH